MYSYHLSCLIDITPVSSFWQDVSFLLLTSSQPGTKRIILYVGVVPKNSITKTKMCGVVEGFWGLLGLLI